MLMLASSILLFFGWQSFKLHHHSLNLLSVYGIKCNSPASLSTWNQMSLAVGHCTKRWSNVYHRADTALVLPIFSYSACPLSSSDFWVQARQRLFPSAAPNSSRATWHNRLVLIPRSCSKYYMVKIHKLSSAITKRSLKETSRLSRSLKLFFFHDAILYFSKGSRINRYGYQTMNL
jgi:hypothetical protein